MRQRVTTARRGLRTVRGWSLALCSGAIAIAAHGMAGGGAPETVLAVLLTTLVAWAGTSIADRDLGMPGVFTALGTSQLGMHLVLNYVIPAHVGHTTATVDTTTMVLSHMVATALTAVLLARADTAVLLVTSATRLLFGMFHAPLPSAVRVAYAVPASRWDGDHLREVLFGLLCARRGPPVRS